MGEGFNFLGASPTVGGSPCVRTPPPPWACSAVTHPALVVGGWTENMTEPSHIPDVWKDVKAIGPRHLPGGWGTGSPLG